MNNLIDAVGSLVVDALASTLEFVYVLYEYFSFSEIILVSLFLFLVFRFLLYPAFGGFIRAKGSDTVRKDIHRDKESAGNG